MESGQKQNVSFKRNRRWKRTAEQKWKVSFDGRSKWKWKRKENVMNDGTNVTRSGQFRMKDRSMETDSYESAD